MGMAAAYMRADILLQAWGKEKNHIYQKLVIILFRLDNDGHDTTRKKWYEHDMDTQICQNYIDKKNMCQNLYNI